MKAWIDAIESKPFDRVLVWCYGTYDRNDALCGFEGYYNSANKKWFAVNNGDYVDGGYGQDYEASVSAWLPLPEAP